MKNWWKAEKAVSGETMIVVYLEYCQIRIYSGHNNNSYNDSSIFRGRIIFYGRKDPIQKRYF